MKRRAFFKTRDNSFVSGSSEIMSHDARLLMFITFTMYQTSFIKLSRCILIVNNT